MYHSNSRSASPGVGAHKPFTPGASGHGIPNENLRLDGGACARSGPREGKKRKKPPPQVGDRQANLTVCATRVNPTAMGGGCLVSLPLAPLKRGWPTRVGSPNAASVPFLPVGTKKQASVVGQEDERQGSIGPTVFRPRVLGGSWWVPWHPPRARDALSTHYWGKGIMRWRNGGTLVLG